MTRVLAVLETMWDWRSMTSGAGYKEESVPIFRINPENHTGRRLYWFLGHERLHVTNACRELVSSASHHGKPDPVWLRKNTLEWMKWAEAGNLVLVCGNVAQSTYDQIPDPPIPDRIIYMPHPAARTWTRRALDFARTLIQEDTGHLRLRLVNGRLEARRL